MGTGSSFRFSRQIGCSRVTAKAPVKALQCSCHLHSFSMDQNLKRDRAVTKKRTGSFTEADEESEEINELFNSAESCRQLFSERKNVVRSRDFSGVGGAIKLSHGAQGVMALVAEAEDESENGHWKNREASRDSNGRSLENGDVSCFLDLLQSASSNDFDQVRASRSDSLNQGIQGIISEIGQELQTE